MNYYTREAISYLSIYVFLFVGFFANFEYHAIFLIPVIFITWSRVISKSLAILILSNPDRMKYFVEQFKNAPKMQYLYICDIPIFLTFLKFSWYIHALAWIYNVWAHILIYNKRVNLEGQDVNS